MLALDQGLFIYLFTYNICVQISIKNQNKMEAPYHWMLT